MRQTRYEWVHLFAAVEPATGASTALLAPYVDTQTMDVFLRQPVKAELKPGEDVILVMDGSGRQVSSKLEVPEEITILLLPPYSPELNPVENRMRGDFEEGDSSDTAQVSFHGMASTVADGRSLVTHVPERKCHPCDRSVPGWSVSNSRRLWRK